MLKSSLCAAFCTLLLSAQVVPAQAELVVNGDFASDANGWTITDTPGGFGFHPVVGNPGGGVLLDNVSPSPSSDPTASQSIGGLIPDVVYLISGDYQRGKVRGDGLPIDVPSFGVALEGGFLFTALAPVDMSWQHFSFNYTASSPTVFLSLSSQINGTGVSYAIDNIQMTAVPEPCSLVLGLSGVGLLLFCRRTRQATKVSEQH